MMEAELGVPVVQHDDGSRNAMYDLRVLYPDGPAGAAEVVAAADGESIALWNLINPGGRWIAPELAGGWSVHLEISARGKRIRNELPQFLMTLEFNGVTSLDTRYGDHPYRSAARDLEIVSAHQGDTEFPGSIYPSIAYPHERLAGFSDETGYGLVQWLDEFLSSDALADVRTKLSASGAPRQHAFVFVAQFATPFAVTDQLVRSDAPIPGRHPKLPDHITDVWVVSSWSTGNGFRWSVDRGWTSFAKHI
jgi:hypothetical protein